MSKSEIKCPQCPLCSGEPDQVISALTWPLQAWCANEECGTVTWNPTLTLDENLMQSNVIDLGGLA